VVPISFVSDELPLPQRQPLQYIAKRGELQRGGGLRFRGMPLGRHRDRDPDGTPHPAARVDGQPDTSARIAGLSPQGNDSTRSPPPARSSRRTSSRSPPPAAPPPPAVIPRTPAALRDHDATAGITLTIPEGDQTMPKYFRTHRRDHDTP